MTFYWDDKEKVWTDKRPERNFKGNPCRIRISDYTVDKLSKNLERSVETCKRHRYLP